MWWHGPEFLYSGSPLLSVTCVKPILCNDTELRKVVLTTLVSKVEHHDVLERLERCSNWDTARRAVAVCVRFTKKLKERITTGQPNPVCKQKRNCKLSEYQPVNVPEMQTAGTLILSIVQRQAFHEEIKVLEKMFEDDITSRKTARHRNKTLKESSTIYRLDPYLSE